MELLTRERAVPALRDAVDQLLELSVVELSDDGALTLRRDIEVELRRMAAFDHKLVAEIDARGVAFDRGRKNTATLLAVLLRIDPGEAKQRVVAAKQHAWRTGISGEPLPPIYPHVAEAVASGSISRVHARIVTDTIDALPGDVQVQRGTEIERALVADAQRFEPKHLRLIGRRYVETYDQDGRLASDEDRERRRFLDVHQHADGTVSGTFHADAVTGEALMTVLDAASRPLPADDGVTTTIVVLMTPEQVERTRDAAGPPTEHLAKGRPRGPTDELVRTGHGALLNLKEVGSLLGGAQFFPVVLGSLRSVEAYVSTHRLFTRGQRLAVIARDRGCSFPGCTASPAWCEGHHVVDFAAGGPNTVDNGTLLCGAHHRDFARLGYRCVMVAGVPHWIAPTWLDPGQTPVRNTAHEAGG